MRIVELLAEKGASLRVLNANFDTKTASGKAFLGMLGVFAEFETNLRRERQLEGIARAKKAGVYKGRQPSIDPAEVRRLKAGGKGATEIARELGVGRASVYRLLARSLSRPIELSR
jgi:DNA invertase Pin-like site-specific DNA recombinase